MYKTENVLVCLDLTEMDEFLVRYANFIVDEMDPKKVTFFHAFHPVDLPGEVMAELPDMDKPIIDMVQEELQEKVDKFFDKKDQIDFQTVVEDGHISEVILQYTKNHKIDLTVIGKKVAYPGNGRITRRIMPLTPSSVLLVSETAQPKLNHILVRMNFSKITELTLKTAIDIANRTGAYVTCFHAYRLPLHQFPQQSEEKQGKITEKMTKHASKEYAAFMKRLKLNPDEIPCTYVYDKESDEAQYLYHHALKHNADMVMIGSKIKSDLANVILDRTTEDMTEVEKNIPVMIIKDRKETIGFLEALFDW
ncbi:MAG: universal stress protein [Bacteroidetes bacterium]|jgi:nucleotide-binding universal stress UspA family protein|nr:universal stress protein [Bacteroidota bacterium]